MKFDYILGILKKEFVRLGRVYPPSEYGGDLDLLKKHREQLKQAIGILEENEDK